MSGYESFVIKRGDFSFNSFTYAVEKNNLSAVKYLVETCKINLSEMFYVHRHKMIEIENID